MSARAGIGIVLLIAGLVLLFFGVQSTGAFGEKVMHEFTGRYTDSTMMYLVGGGIVAALGVVLLVVGRK
jgi:hypothetical protein